MVRLIMGVKGSGKTKQLIELINAAAKDEAGNVVCIEPKRDMSYNIHYNIRLIDAQEYDLHSYEMFRGFISGLYAGNYDITDIFVDSVLKIGGTDMEQLATFVEKLAHLNVHVVMSVSAAKDEIPARVADLAEEI